MVISELTTNLSQWFVIKKEETKEETKHEVKHEIKDECIYIIFINNKPYGYYHSENDTDKQVEQAKEQIMLKHSFDFKKNYYWVDLPLEEDTILKMKLVSNNKDVIPVYDYVEDSLEIIKSKLLPLHKE